MRSPCTVVLLSLFLGELFCSITSVTLITRLTEQVSRVSFCTKFVVFRLDGSLCRVTVYTAYNFLILRYKCSLHQDTHFHNKTASLSLHITSCKIRGIRLEKDFCETTTVFSFIIFFIPEFTRHSIILVTSMRRLIKLVFSL